MRFGTTVKSSPDLYQTNTRVDPISLVSCWKRSPGKRCTIYLVNLESGYFTKDDTLLMGHCQVLLPLCPLQGETVVVGIQQGRPCGSIGTVTTGQEPVVDGFPASPHSIQILPPRHQGPSTYEAILSEYPHSTVLTRCGLPRSLC